MGRQYFWLYGKKVYWNIREFKRGEPQYFTVYNKAGNPRRIFNCFKNAHVGDLVIGYQSAPIAQILAIFRVCQEIEDPDDTNAVIGFEKVIDVPNGITKQDLIDQRLGEIAPLRNSQGSIFPLTEIEFKKILKIIEDNNPGLFEQFTELNFNNYELAERKETVTSSRSLNAQTKIMSAFTTEELLDIFGFDAPLVPRVYEGDDTLILFEGEGIQFKWNSSKKLVIEYEISGNRKRRHGFDLRNDLEIPEIVLIMNKESQNLYRFMGKADLRVIGVDAKRKGYHSYNYIVSLEANIRYEEEIDIDVMHIAEVYGDMDPKTMEQLVTTFYRSPEVAAYAKKSANGICQLCGKPAPFIDKNGEPYLESHHVIWLSRGGTDTIDNVVGLCPNCHSKVHAIDDPIDIGTMLMAISEREDQQ